MRYLTEDPIDAEVWHRETANVQDGASVEFLGVVRGKEGDRQIPYLDYESYIPMAE
ncbi:MAG: molybdenum cofactor biosynthesis protein MoaE, partial [Candidatus Omnitrophica bacterium]|nr:molybdenum cofactor biosynthesis protein MoaE [Candidatus Omnitrophota bacterium]